VTGVATCGQVSTNKTIAIKVKLRSRSK